MVEPPVWYISYSQTASSPQISGWKSKRLESTTFRSSGILFLQRKKWIGDQKPKSGFRKHRWSILQFRSASCKITWKAYIWHICIYRPLNPHYKFQQKIHWFSGISPLNFVPMNHLAPRPHPKSSSSGIEAIHRLWSHFAGFSHGVSDFPFAFGYDFRILRVTVSFIQVACWGLRWWASLDILKNGLPAQQLDVSNSHFVAN